MVILANSVFSSGGAAVDMTFVRKSKSVVEFMVVIMISVVSLGSSRISRSSGSG